MKTYWLGIIGPVEDTDVPQGGDLPMRMAVRDEIEKLIPNFGNPVFSSGWDVTEEQRKRVLDALYAEHRVHWTLRLRAWLMSKVTWASRQ